jgi:hypothetical protein
LSLKIKIKLKLSKGVFTLSKYDKKIGISAIPITSRKIEIVSRRHKK